MKPYLIYDERTHEIVVRDILSHNEAEEILAGMLIDPDYCNHRLRIKPQDTDDLSLVALEELHGPRDGYIHFEPHDPF